LRQLLLDLLVCVIVSVGEDERGRLAGEVAPADEPLISLKAGVLSNVRGVECWPPLAVAGSGC
jgi:hypothetical protein